MQTNETLDLGTFEYEKDTKNSVRFVRGNQTMYVPKDKLGSSRPASINVTITALEEG
jgi:hypothetical protein